MLELPPHPGAPNTTNDESATTSSAARRQTRPLNINPTTALALTMALLQDPWPAVVVLDKALLDVSGLNLHRIIKTEGRTESTFVLVLLDDASDQLDAFELGAADGYRR